MKPKPCKHCGSEFHQSFQCPTIRKPLKTYKPMNKVGRVARETSKAVARWKRTQEPNHEGYYVCYMCGRWIKYLMAEHTKSKARYPQFRTDTKKLKPTCDSCNEIKGSKDYEDIIENA